MADRSIATESVQSFKSKSVSKRVIDTIAKAEAVDPIELDPLHTAIDPDALDSLFHSERNGSGETSGPSGEIRFRYHGYDVRVTAGGLVNLTEL